MRTIIIRLVLLILIAAPVGAVHAQDEPNPGCDINLEALILQLVQAQREADSGNSFNAVQIMNEVQGDLDSLTTRCQGVLYPLPRAFTAADNSITFRYPEDWALAPLPDGGYVAASTQALANDVAGGDLDDLAPGDQMLIVLPMLLDDEPLTFDAFTDDFVDNSMVPAFDEVSQQAAHDAGGQPARRYAIRGEGFDGFIVLIDYTGLESPAVLMLAAFVAPGEAASIEPVLAAFETTVRYPASLRPSGAALDDLQYTQAIPITEISDAINFRTMALAPDGSSIAWYNQAEHQICVTPIDTPDDTFCDPLPETFGGRPPLLHWSPDSRHIAFTSDFYRLFLEADIMIYDVEGRSVVNYTDDGISRWQPGAGSPEGESQGPMWIDAIMTWGPDGYLYFWRDDLADPADLESAQTGLYRVKPGDSQPELVRDMTGVFDRFAVYYAMENPLDGAMSISPDASQIALLIRERERTSPRNGVWVVSLADENEPAQHVATYADLRAGLPSDEDPELIMDPTGVAWGEGGLYVTANNYAYGDIGYGLVHYIDLDTGTITPLTDFSDLTRPEVLMVDDATGHTPQCWMPRGAVLAPDGSGLIGFGFTPPEAGLWALRMVNGQGEQTLLYHIEEVEVMPSLISGIAQDGTLLMYGYLFRP